MKIALWNLERLQKNKSPKIVEILQRDNADIIVLTESSSFIDLAESHPYLATTKDLQELDANYYKQGELRVMIYSKYPIGKRYPTYDEFTTLCVDITTPGGPLIFYGTIIGVLGGNGRGRKGYQNDLIHQIKEYNLLLKNNRAVIAGDLNTSFTGYPYPSKADRETLNSCFKELKMTNLSERYVDLNVTNETSINVDHLIISDSFLNKAAITNEIWNENKKLSDHIGFSIRFNE